MPIPSQEDYLNWDTYSQGVDEIGELSGLEKSQATDAFNYLRRTLGQDFLRNASARVPYAAQHPFFSLLLNRAPWTRREIVRWSEALRVLEATPNLNKVLAKLEDPREFAHSDLLIKSAARLVNQGLKASFEPVLPLATNQKQPDVKFDNPSTKEAFFLEAAVQTTAKREQEAFEAMSAVTSCFMAVGPGVRWAGRMYKTPSTRHLQEIVEKIDRALVRVAKEKSFVQICEEDTFEIAVCEEDQLSLLSEWCSTQDLKPGEFIGPPYDTNYVERLKQKIRSEQEQLPKEAPSAILIHYTDVFIHTRDVRRLMAELEEEVYEHPHVPFVIISGAILAGAGLPAVVQKGEHRYALRYADLMGEHILILVNRFSPTRLSADLFARVLRAF